MSSMQEPYLAKIRDITNVPIDILRRDMGFVEDTKKPEVKSEERETPQTRESSNEKATKFILASLLHKKPYCKENYNYRKLISGRDYIFDIIEQKLTISSIFDRYEVENDAFLSDLIYFDFSQFASNEERYFQECLHLKLEELFKAQKEEITARFKVCEDLAERRKLLEKLAEINKKLLDKNLEEFDD